MARRTPQPSRKPSPINPRVRALRKRLSDTNVDALLVTHTHDIRYLIGFVGDDAWALIPRRGSSVYILSDFRFQEQIAREAPAATAIMRKRSLADELVELTKKRKLDRIGLQPAHVTLAMRKALVKRLGAKRLAEIDDGLATQRGIKDETELRAIRRSLRIQEQAFKETLPFIEPGRREREIAAHLEYRMRMNGAEARSFPTIVAVDANASLPHAVPGEKKVKKGSSILIDWGAQRDGYCSDLTRCLAIGRMKPRIREIYNIVLEAQQAAIEAIRPGVALRDVDAAARDHISRAGYGKQFGHSLGHGIGLEVHEQPGLSPRSPGELVAGQIVTVEPGIYLPGVGGVRIEDDVRVTQRGAQVLSRLPKSLESAII